MHSPLHAAIFCSVMLDTILKMQFSTRNLMLSVIVKWRFSIPYFHLGVINAQYSWRTFCHVYRPIVTGPGRAMCPMCLCVWTIVTKLNDPWPRFLAWWFTLALSRPSSTVKVIHQSSRSKKENVAIVVGTTLSDGFLVCTMSEDAIALSYTGLATVTQVLITNISINWYMSSW